MMLGMDPEFSLGVLFSYSHLPLKNGFWSKRLLPEDLTLLVHELVFRYVRVLSLALVGLLLVAAH